MKTSLKIALLIATPIVIGIVSYGVMLKQADYDSITMDYRYNTGYYKDQKAIGREFIKDGPGEGEYTTGSVPFDTPLPDDLSVNSLINWVNSLRISDERKSLIINSLQMSGQARYVCESYAHDNFSQDSLVGKDIECSGFVNWGLHKIGLSTSDLGLVEDLVDNTSGKFRKIPDDELMPGDYKAYKKPGRWSTGHVGMYLGKTKDGKQIFIDAGSPAGSATPKIREHQSLSSGFALRYLPLEEKDKAAIDTGVATDTGNKSYTSGGSLSVDTPVPDDYQNASIVKQYINSLNISSKRKAIVNELYDRQGRWTYEYGGAGRNIDVNAEPPDGLRIDCSGTIRWIYNRVLHTNKFNDYTTSQSAALMTEVAQPLPGDSVWKSGHVEIYVGRLSDGRIVTIGSGNGKVPNAKIHSGLQDGKPRKFYRPKELE